MYCQWLCRTECTVNGYLVLNVLYFHSLPRTECTVNGYLLKNVLSMVMSYRMYCQRLSRTEYYVNIIIIILRTVYVQ